MRHEQKDIGREGELQASGLKPQVLIVAGESSGDLHGARLVKAIRRRVPGARFFGLGGDKMESEGVEIFRDVTKHAAVGIVEGLLSYPRLATTFFRFASEARRRKPDVAVLIDFPEFNLRLAKRLKKAGIPVVYYVCPQLWAWRTYRVHQMARYVDKSLVILPFEERFYHRYGVDASYVGNPILDTIKHPDDIKGTLREDLNVPEDHKLIGLMPGSRRKEVQRLMPIIAESAQLIKARIPKVTFVLGQASKISEKKIRKTLGCEPFFSISSDVYNVMKSSDLLIVASGTATLEAAVLGTPMVVVYKVSPLTWLMFIGLLRVKSYALCNIVAGSKVVPELIQWRAQPQMIARRSLAMFENGMLDETRRKLAEVRRKLGPPGASDRAAEYVIGYMRKR
jgi:lipid-A-disaccharide synthase